MATPNAPDLAETKFETYQTATTSSDAAPRGAKALGIQRLGGRTFYLYCITSGYAVLRA